MADDLGKYAHIVDKVTADLRGYQDCSCSWCTRQRSGQAMRHQRELEQTMQGDFIIVGARYGFRHGEGVCMTAAHQLVDVDIRYETSMTSARTLQDSFRITATGLRPAYVTAHDYPQAWQRLFDRWNPPSFTDQTRAQILTDFIFNPRI